MTTPPAGLRSWNGGRSWLARHTLQTAGVALGVLLIASVTLGCTADEPSGPPTADDSAASSAERNQPRAEPEGNADDGADDGRPASVRLHRVARVIDGDTIELANGRDVRIVGIDTPERGQCGYDAATLSMRRLVEGKEVRVTRPDEDTDRYGRLLRYVNVGPMDAGLRQIKRGLAIARYESRDGYGFHPREPVYIRADNATRPLGCPVRRHAAAQPPGGGGKCAPGYSPCLPVVADLDCSDFRGGVRVTGSDPYRLDADGDGIGCDS